MLHEISRDSAFVPPQVLEKQREYAELVKTIVSSRFGGRAGAFVHTYGCQGNVSDSERIKGQLREMGFSFVSSPEQAQLVLFNTCAVREHAQDRVFGNVGALKPIKEKNRDMIIALCGCMMQQEHVAQRIKKSYPYVNLVFGTFAMHLLPQMLYKVLSGGRRVFNTEKNEGLIAEGLPVERDFGARAWLPVMYGCNNFCSYCIVPYVRGRERSRRPEDVLNEARELVKSGAKEITLLGQNVNSYGRYPDCSVNFAELLSMINSIPGDFMIRFMTSHPKDCTRELLDTMARCEKVARHLHLPVQSGSDRILSLMNRRYTRSGYIELIDYARSVMPDISITSDIIVGFPGETFEDFSCTLSLVERVEYTSLFTFIYSKREGTKAAELPDEIEPSEKSRWFSILCRTQESIAARRTAGALGKRFVVLAEAGEREGVLAGRTQGNVIIEFRGDKELIGKFCLVEVTEALTWTLKGRAIKTDIKFTEYKGES